MPSPSSRPKARRPTTVIALGLLVWLGAGLSARFQSPTAQPAAAARQGPDALAKALQQRYQGIKDFTADFSQSYKGGVLRTRTIEQGTVSVKKPGLMRWEYLKPEKKEFVSDGRKTYLYVPQDKQVIVADADT